MTFLRRFDDIYPLKDFCNRFGANIGNIYSMLIATETSLIPEQPFDDFFADLRLYNVKGRWFLKLDQIRKLITNPAKAGRKTLFRSPQTRYMRS
jgi:hypothetical protein